MTFLVVHEFKVSFILLMPMKLLMALTLLIPLTLLLALNRMLLMDLLMDLNRMLLMALNHMLLMALNRMLIMALNRTAVTDSKHICKVLSDVLKHRHLSHTHGMGKESTDHRR